MRAALAVVAALVLIGIACPSFGRVESPDVHDGAASVTTSPNAARLKTERVVTFKDGYALVVKRGEGTADKEGRVTSSSVPETAVLGSFWAFGTNGAKLESVRAEWLSSDESSATEPCESPAEILFANPGKQVTIERERGEPLSGVVVPQARPHAAPRDEPREDVRPAPVWSADNTSEWPPQGRGYTAARAEVKRPDSLVILDVPERGRMAIDAQEVRSVVGRNLSIECRPADPSSRTKQLVFDFGPSAAGQKVQFQLLYFSSGFRWIPTYRLDESNAKKATLSLQAELVNDLEDIDRASVDLVVGVPNFKFKSVTSPLILESALRSTIAQAAPNLVNAMASMGNAYYSTRTVETPKEPQEAAPALIPTTSAGEDLFVYNVPKISLAKGARAAVPIWSRELPMRDIYTLDITSKRGRSGDQLNYGADRNSPQNLATAAVWHQVEIEAPSDLPLTAGSVLILKGEIPQGQDLLTYTPRGGKVLVPITLSPNMRPLHEETEVARNVAVTKVDNHDVTELRKKGTLTVENPGASRVLMQVTLATGGKVESASDSGKIKADSYQYNDWSGWGVPSLNGHSNVTWELELAPGEKRTITYVLNYWI